MLTPFQAYALLAGLVVLCVAEWTWIIRSMNRRVRRYRAAQMIRRITEASHV